MLTLPGLVERGCASVVTPRCSGAEGPRRERLVQRRPAGAGAEMAPDQVQLLGHPLLPLERCQSLDERSQLDIGGAGQGEVWAVRPLLDGQVGSPGGRAHRLGEPAQGLPVTPHSRPQHAAAEAATAGEGQRQRGVAPGGALEPADHVIARGVADLAEKREREVPLLRAAPPQLRRQLP